MTISHNKALVALLALGGLTTATAAQPSEYQIELMVYSHISPAAIASEHWPAGIDGSSLSTKQTTPLEPATFSDLANYPTLTYLPQEAWALDKDAKRIETRLHGTILYHQAWRVSAQALRAKTMYFTINNQSMQNWNESPSFENDQPKTALSGSFSVKLKRYFNTDLQLTLGEPSSEIKPYLKNQRDPCGPAKTCYFGFDVKRRTRSATLNYLDHPLYGALMLITPVKAPSGKS